MLEFRNPVWGNATHTFIEMEIKLDATVRPHWEDMDGQWIPFSATADDVMEYGRDLFEGAVASGATMPFTPPTLEDIRSAMSPLTPREFRDALIDNDIMPDQVTAAISQITDPKARAKALNAWEYPTLFTRTDLLVDQIGTIFGLTPEKIDMLWTEASYNEWKR